MATPQQLPLFTRTQECAGYLSPNRRGYFSVLKDIDGRKNQRSYPLCDTIQVLENLDPRYNTWCTQAEFFTPNRRLTGLARIDLQFTDLDTYRISTLQGRPPSQLVEATLRFCNDEGLLPPSILVFSGRGLHAKWLLEHPVPRRALPRWNAVQRALVARLAPLGADPQAKDASRVLRLVNTVNTKTGDICQVVHATFGQDGLPIRYNFEQLAAEMLPVGRQELEQRKRDLAQRHQLRVINGSKTGHLRRFSGRQLAWDRLEDLRRLMELRKGAKEGERMRHLFWQLNFLLLSGATNSQLMYHEAASLARQIDPAWGYASPELMTLYQKAKGFEAGERVEFNGRKYPSLYTPKNDTLIGLFEISTEEQRQMSTLISLDMGKERDRERHEAKRRAEGVQERREYLGEVRVSPDKALAGKHLRQERYRRKIGSVSKEEIAIQVASRRKQARELKSKGLSIRLVAQQMNIPKSTVMTYLKPL